MYERIKGIPVEWIFTMQKAQNTGDASWIFKLQLIFFLVSVCNGTRNVYYGIDGRYQRNDHLDLAASTVSAGRFFSGAGNSYEFKEDGNTKFEVAREVARPRRRKGTEVDNSKYLRRFIEDFEVDEGLETWNGGDRGEDDNELANFLNELTRRRKFNPEDLGEYDLNEMLPGRRGARKRKLTSHEQGILLVETLKKKKNYTQAGDLAINDHRGHSGNNAVQSGIMDMLGRSMLILGSREVYLFIFIFSPLEKIFFSLHFLNEKISENILFNSSQASGIFNFFYIIEEIILRFFCQFKNYSQILGKFDRNF